jgi:hypothetical protein
MQAGNGESQGPSFRSAQAGNPNKVGRINQNSDRTFSVNVLTSVRHRAHRFSVAFGPADFQELQIPKPLDSSVTHTGSFWITSQLSSASASHFLAEHPSDGRNGGQNASTALFLTYARILVWPIMQCSRAFSGRSLSFGRFSWLKTDDQKP